MCMFPSDLSCWSRRILIYNRSDNFASCMTCVLFKFNTWSLDSEPPANYDESETMPLIQPAIWIGLCEFSMLYWQFHLQSNQVRQRVTIRARDWWRTITACAGVRVEALRRTITACAGVRRITACAGVRCGWNHHSMRRSAGVEGGHGLSSPTPQFHRYTMCWSHELQVHVIDTTRRYIHGDSSPSWHPRCVRLHAFFFGFPVYSVCTLRQSHVIICIIVS